MTEHASELTTMGFTRVAQWQSDKNDGIRIDGAVPKLPGLYVFLVGTKVFYVGSAAKTLHGRMLSYLRRQRSDRLDRPVHMGLAEAIRADEPVWVYTLPVTQDARAVWPKADLLPVSVLLGAEAALIERFHPAANRRGRLVLVAASTDPDDGDAE